MTEGRRICRRKIHCWVRASEARPHARQTCALGREAAADWCSGTFWGSLVGKHYEEQRAHLPLADTIAGAPGPLPSLSGHCRAHGRLLTRVRGAHAPCCFGRQGKTPIAQVWCTAARLARWHSQQAAKWLGGWSARLPTCNLRFAHCVLLVHAVAVWRIHSEVHRCLVCFSAVPACDLATWRGPPGLVSTCKKEQQLSRRAHTAGPQPGCMTALTTNPKSTRTCVCSGVCSLCFTMSHCKPHRQEEARSVVKWPLRLCTRRQKGGRHNRQGVTW
jgi:hypothetical protein